MEPDGASLEAVNIQFGFLPYQSRKIPGGFQSDGFRCSPRPLPQGGSSFVAKPFARNLSRDSEKLLKDQVVGEVASVGPAAQDIKILIKPH